MSTQRKYSQKNADSSRDQVTGGGLAKGGSVSLFVDGKKDGEGRVEQAIPMLFSTDETCDVGKETGSPTSPDYSGEGHWGQIDVEK